MYKLFHNSDWSLSVVETDSTQCLSVVTKIDGGCFTSKSGPSHSLAELLKVEVENTAS